MGVFCTAGLGRGWDRLGVAVACAGPDSLQRVRAAAAICARASDAPHSWLTTGCKADAAALSEAAAAGATAAAGGGEGLDAAGSGRHVLVGKRGDHASAAVWLHVSQRRGQRDH